MPAPVDAHCTDWSGDPSFRGSYSDVAAGVRSGDVERTVAEARAPVAGRVFFAGEAFHPELMGSVNAAWETGRAAAEEIAAADG